MLDFFIINCSVPGSTCEFNPKIQKKNTHKKSLSFEHNESFWESRWNLLVYRMECLTL